MVHTEPLVGAARRVSDWAVARPITAVNKVASAQMQPVAQIGILARAQALAHETRQVTAEPVRRERRSPYSPDRRTSANEASRHVGAVELTDSPMARAEACNTRARAAAAIAPATIGPHVR